MLPEDPNMLYSYINTKLRDEYGSFAAFCEDTGADPQAVTEKLAAAGYTYDEARNRFQ